MYETDNEGWKEACRIIEVACVSASAYRGFGVVVAGGPQQAKRASARHWVGFDPIQEEVLFLFSPCVFEREPFKGLQRPPYPLPGTATIPDPEPDINISITVSESTSIRNRSTQTSVSRKRVSVIPLRYERLNIV